MPEELEGHAERVSICRLSLSHPQESERLLREEGKQNSVLPSRSLGHENPEVRAGKWEGEKVDRTGVQACRTALARVTYRLLQAPLGLMGC